MTKIAFRAGLAALATASMLLSGCGGSDSAAESKGGTPTTAASQAPADNGVAALAAEEILTKAKDALTKAGSFHMAGSATTDGETMSLDFKVSGKDFAGKMSMGKDAEVEILSVGGKQYMKPSEGFWAMIAGAEQAKTMVKATGGKWVLVPAKDQISGLFAAADVNELLKPGGALSKGEATKVGEQPVITLKDASDADAQVFVATTGEPYPVRIGKSATGEGVTFSKFGEKFEAIAAPAADQVIDQNSLGK
ncbi:hypothetical protein Aph02nite_12880 [Actinoplanes philippinensis]|uniref:Lipoprotein n=1 Tax=Actinoplanes philippinensis TaxID=35752 RepID=A0A1I1ZR57_9ACTN|nr:hypothetical protein [Actinoplanes philippinensis]GIE75338.1 hypothetical protein Aph02nite_12880 [Actinoplanes philippinensis]SFE34141.1 hypothetical protein SAMN05421541_101251 [Actinoplanes philippinensis]